MVAFLLLNFMEVFSVHGGALLECVFCACDPSVHLSVSSIGLFMLYMSEVILLIKSLRAGSQAFSLLMLSLCGIFA